MPEPSVQPKSGVKTTEFWLVIVSGVIAGLTHLQGQLDAQWLVLVISGLTALYNFGRNLVKSNTK